MTQAPVIPDSVTNMADCFARCTSLTQAPVIPSSVTKMEECFMGCPVLKNVSIYTTNCTWYYCFYECSSFVSITVPNQAVKDDILAAGNVAINASNITIK
ncbi:MAG: leucine-rich repeat domain-containing protein [Treponemataceae bacterium]|nr:leucine-rich repeat domain-containing protein [Treponemataceae bacterium]